MIKKRNYKRELELQRENLKRYVVYVPKTEADLIDNKLELECKKVGSILQEALKNYIKK